MRPCLMLVLAALLATAATAGADTVNRNVLGASAAGQAVSFNVSVDFVPTGGNFGAGTGTATVRFTLQNTSSVFPLQSPVLGNPLLTEFLFNLPAGTGMTYSQ